MIHSKIAKKLFRPYLQPFFKLYVFFDHQSLEPLQVNAAPVGVFDRFYVSAAPGLRKVCRLPHMLMCLETRTAESDSRAKSRHGRFFWGGSFTYRMLKENNVSSKKTQDIDRAVV